MSDKSAIAAGHFELSEKLVSLPCDGSITLSGEQCNLLIVEYMAMTRSAQRCLARVHELEAENEALEKRADPFDLDRQVLDVQISSLTNDRDEAREEVKALRSHLANAQATIDLLNREMAAGRRAIDDLAVLRGALRLLAGVR